MRPSRCVGNQSNTNDDGRYAQFSTIFKTAQRAIKAEYTHLIHSINTSFARTCSKRAVTKIPRARRFDRKGIRLEQPSQYPQPVQLARCKERRVTLLASFMTFVIQVNGTTMTSAAEQVNESFHIGDEAFAHSYWPVLSWNLGGAAAPMIGLPLMDKFGVRKSYMVSCVWHWYCHKC